LSNLGQWAALDLASAENIEPSHIVEAISVKEAWIREDRACDSQMEVARHLKLHYSTVSRLIKSVKSKGIKT
jgi:DNA-binding MarR family transcriptional regulator